MDAYTVLGILGVVGCSLYLGLLIWACCNRKGHEAA